MTDRARDPVASGQRIPRDIRALLVCPRCRGALVDVPAADPTGLVCEACRVVFPIEAGIPVLLIERASAWPSDV